MSNGGRRAELDGVRGIAILLVLVGHSYAPIEPIGSVGVTVFFVLSGYLITGLLLKERARHGRLDLRRFYARRFTRLAPPLFLILAVMAPLAGSQVVAPALWLTNYATLFGVNVSPFPHTWSLAVEEQFYLVWPVALIALLRRRQPARVLLAAILALSAWRLLLIATGHAAYAGRALETAGVALLVGCLVALSGWSPKINPVPSVGALALVVIVAPFAPNVAPVLAAPVAASLVASASDMPWLAWRPLAFCGVTSYSMYLWHVPVSLLVGFAPLGVPLGASVGIAAYALLERPLMVWRSRERVPSVVAELPQPALL